MEKDASANKWQERAKKEYEWIEKDASAKENREKQ
jgi:hypothetical protein